MIAFSNAKINLGLHVRNKRSDGYHTIESVFYPVPWYDILEIVPSADFQFQSSGLELDNQSNLIISAYQLMKDHYRLENVSIHLNKQIPMGAGLGGGSSNAAHTIMVLNDLFQLNLSKEKMTELALELGSDCPFFIHNQPALVKGRGEIIEQTDINVAGDHIKLIYPDLHIPTALAFQEVIPRDRDLPKNLLDMQNDFEEPLFRAFPKLEQIKQGLLEEGAYYAAMTGSGSTIFGLFKESPVKNTNYSSERIFQLA